MKTELRPLKPRERSQLKSHVRYRAGGIDDFLFAWLVLGGLATLVVTFIATKVAGYLYLVHIVVVSMTISALFAFRHARQRRRKSSEFQPTIKADLELGQAEVCTFDASEAIAVEEFEDEGTGFYLRVGPKNVLFLVGQHLDQLAEEKKFPCKKFELVRSPKSQIPLDINCLGDYLPPFGTLPPFREDDFEKERVPCDGDLLELDFEVLKRSVVKHE